MHMKSQPLVDANGTAVVFKYIEDNKGVVVIKEHCDQCSGDRRCESLSTCFWCSQKTLTYMMLD